MTPLESSVPLASLTPMALMTPMNRHLHQWIANVSNGADDAIKVIDSTGFHWRLWKVHRNEMVPMQAFKLHQCWSSLAPMAIGCTIGAIRSITIGDSGSPLAPFLSPLVQMAPMTRIPNRHNTYTLFYSTKNTEMWAMWQFDVDSMYIMCNNQKRWFKK